MARLYDATGRPLPRMSLGFQPKPLREDDGGDALASACSGMWQEYPGWLTDEDEA